MRLLLHCCLYLQLWLCIRASCAQRIITAPVMRRIMQARRRMLNQGWSKQLDAVQLCMRSPDCSFFSYLANSNSPAIHWSFWSLSLQLAANSLSLPPRVSEPEVGGGACLFAGEFVRNARWCGIRGGQGLMSLARGCEGSSAWVTCRVGRLCIDRCSCAV